VSFLAGFSAARKALYLPGEMGARKELSLQLLQIQAVAAK
jgi:hypothetical protein